MNSFALQDFFVLIDRFWSNPGFPFSSSPQFYIKKKKWIKYSWPKDVSTLTISTELYSSLYFYYTFKCVRDFLLHSLKLVWMDFFLIKVIYVMK